MTHSGHRRFLKFLFCRSKQDLIDVDLVGLTHGIDHGARERVGWNRDLRVEFFDPLGGGIGHAVRQFGGNRARLTSCRSPSESARTAYFVAA